MFALRVYQNALARRPALTQCISAGILAGTGDAFSQLVVEGKRKRDYDPMRTARFAAVISGLMAPALYKWFQFLERFRGPFYPLKRVFIDQTIAAPVCTAAVISSLSLMEGHRFNESIEATREKFWPILTTNYKIWPFVQLFNFYFIPLYYRIIFVQAVGIFWNSYLSYMTQANQELQSI